MIKPTQQYQMSVPLSTNKRKLDDDDTARISSKKQRTRVRYSISNFTFAVSYLMTLSSASPAVNAIDVNKR